MRHPDVLIFSGSVRGGSLNTKLAALVAKKLAIADANVTRISLADYPLPLFDGDLERDKGIPENATKLARLMASQDGVFIACPEYNAGITPLLKNTLDWISRVKGPGIEPPFKERVFAIGSAAPGAFGGIRGLIGVRTILEVGLGANVIPETVAIPKAGSAFGDKGELLEERPAAQLDALVRRFLKEMRYRL